MRRSGWIVMVVLNAALLAGCSSGARSGSGNTAGSSGSANASGGADNGGMPGGPAGDASGGTGGAGSPNASGGADVGGMSGGVAGANESGGSGGVAGGVGGGSSGGTPVDPFSAVPGGAISVGSLYYSVGVPTLEINPHLPVATGAQGPTCSSTRSGDCLVSTCTGGDLTPKRLSAGVITVDSPAANIHQFVTPDSQGLYSGTQGAAAFGGGEAFTLSATGADIPAFTLNLQFPLLLLSSQAPAATGTTSIIPAPQGSPVILTWQRGAPGVWFLAQSINNSGNTGAECYFDSQAGTGTIPADVLSTFATGQQFILLTAIAATVEAGPPLINAWVAGEVLTPDKKARVLLQVQ